MEKNVKMKKKVCFDPFYVFFPGIIIDFMLKHLTVHMHVSSCKPYRFFLWVKVALEKRA